MLTKAIFTPEPTFQSEPRAIPQGGNRSQEYKPTPKINKGINHRFYNPKKDSPEKIPYSFSYSNRENPLIFSLDENFGTPRLRRTGRLEREPSTRPRQALAPLKVFSLPNNPPTRIERVFAHTFEENPPPAKPQPQQNIEEVENIYPRTFSNGDPQIFHLEIPGNDLEIYSGSITESDSEPSDDETPINSANLVTDEGNPSYYIATTSQKKSPSPPSPEQPVSQEGIFELEI